jgi:hypothetical protein
MTINDSPTSLPVDSLVDDILDLVSDTAVVSRGEGADGYYHDDRVHIPKATRIKIAEMVASAVRCVSADEVKA